MGDDKEEDGFPVWSSFVETCKIIKGEFPHICSCYVLSDGAGCYSGAYLAINLAVVGSITGIFVLAHYIAKSGRGKSCLDANFGVLISMKHVKKVVNANLKEWHIAFAENLKVALGIILMGGVKANVVKEIVFKLD